MELTETRDGSSSFEERLGKLIGSLPINLVYFDRENLIQGMSDAVLNEFGYRPEEVIHHRVTDFQPLEASEKFSSRHPNFWNEGDITLDTKVKSQNGDHYKVRASITIDRDEKGDAAGAIAVIEVMANSSAESWREHQSDLPYGLTNRECEVLQVAATGRTSKQVGEVLGISHETVNKHVSHILVKMDTSSRIDACVRAVQEGWLYQPRTARRVGTRQAGKLTLMKS